MTQNFNEELNRYIIQYHCIFLLIFDINISLFLGDAIYILDLNEINQIYSYFIYICLRISNNQRQLNNNYTYIGNKTWNTITFKD